jgi:hypothetical protein
VLVTAKPSKRLLRSIALLSMRFNSVHDTTHRGYTKHSVTHCYGDWNNSLAQHLPQS